MKSKPLIVISCILLAPLSSFSQAEINFGIKGGANLSLFLGEDAGETTFLTAPHLGGLAQLTLGENNEGFISYAFQAEVFYSMQGAKETNGKTTLSYLNVPIMVQRYFGSSGFYIETGPQIGFLLAAKTKDSNGTTNIKSQSKAVDIALNVGIGYKFNSGIGISARYSNGLTSVSSNGDVKNATLGFGLFYIFGHNNNYY